MVWTEGHRNPGVSARRDGAGGLHSAPDPQDLHLLPKKVNAGGAHVQTDQEGQVLTGHGWDGIWRHSWSQGTGMSSSWCQGNSKSPGKLGEGGTDTTLAPWWAGMTQQQHTGVPWGKMEQKESWQGHKLKSKPCCHCWSW